MGLCQACLLHTAFPATHAWWPCRALGAGADLKEFDIDNKYGLAAIKHCLQDITGETSVMPGVQVSDFDCFPPCNHAKLYFALY